MKYANSMLKIHTLQKECSEGVVMRSIPNKKITHSTYLLNHYTNKIETTYYPCFLYNIM